MSQRVSGYTRKENDCYETPEWVTEALVPHLSFIANRIWEPACGSGKMVRVLSAASFRVIGSDIEAGVDFLEQRSCGGDYDAIVTNPPFGLAREFIEHGLLMARVTAMLLRTDYDHAKTRQHLFGGCPSFAKKIVLTKRIVWFDRPGAAPSFNHAWFIWDREHKGQPVLAYAP